MFQYDYVKLLTNTFVFIASSRKILVHSSLKSLAECIARRKTIHHAHSSEQFEAYMYLESDALP